MIDSDSLEYAKGAHGSVTNISCPMLGFSSARGAKTRFSPELHDLLRSHKPPELHFSGTTFYVTGEQSLFLVPEVLWGQGHGGLFRCSALPYCITCISINTEKSGRNHFSSDSSSQSGTSYSSLIHKGQKFMEKQNQKVHFSAKQKKTWNPCTVFIIYIFHEYSEDSSCMCVCARACVCVHGINLGASFNTVLSTSTTKRL